MVISMEKESFEIKPILYLAGFHLHRPDYNIKSIKGDLYNFISEKANRIFEIIPIDDHLEILKSRENKLFEVRFDSTSLIYQDGELEYPEFKENALEILKHWQALTSNSRTLRIAGLLRKIVLSTESPKGVYRSRIYDNYLTNLEIGGKKKNIKLHLNYSYEKKGLDYNINLDLEEIIQKDYRYELRIDVNKLDFDRMGNIDFNKVLETFDFAEKYYNDELFDDIGISIR